MYPHVAKFGVPLLLHQVVADLVNQLKFCAENFLESLRHLFKENQAIDNGKISTRRYGIQIATIMLRFRREITEVYIADNIRLFRLRHIEIIGRQPVSPAARPGMRLYKQRPGFFGALQLDKVVLVVTLAFLRGLDHFCLALHLHCSM